MKHLMTLTLLLAALMMVAGCDDDDNSVVKIDEFPQAPQGVYSITGDGAIWILWNGSYESDINYYKVYRSLEATTGYSSIGQVDHIPPDQDFPVLHEFVDNTAANGTTYWYAVSAVDNAGQESVLSGEWVFDTPRPDGNSTLLPTDLSAAASGFNFATTTILNWDSPAADIFVDRFTETVGSETYVYVFVNAGVNTEYQTDIQDMGYTASFDEIGWAPSDGWSELGYCEALVGHTYVVWTSDDHYAKVRITAISASGAITFDWAYQTVEGNLELAPRPERDDPEPKSSVTMQLLK